LLKLLQSAEAEEGHSKRSLYSIDRRISITVGYLTKKNPCTVLFTF